MYRWLKHEGITEQQILDRLTNLEGYDDKESEKVSSSTKYIPFSLLVGIWRYSSAIEIEVSDHKWSDAHILQSGMEDSLPGKEMQSLLKFVMAVRGISDMPQRIAAMQLEYSIKETCAIAGDILTKIDHVLNILENNSQNFLHFLSVRFFFWKTVH